MMPVQRTRMLRTGEKQVVKWTAEGTVKSIRFSYTQYSVTCGIRQLPGICWYPAKSTGIACEARWHRGFFIRP